MFRSWTFQKKMRTSFAVMLGVTLLTAVVAVLALQTVVASKNAVLSLHVRAMLDARRLQEIGYKQAAGFRGYMASPEERFLREYHAARQEFPVVLDDLQTALITSEGKGLAVEIRQL